MARSDNAQIDEPFEKVVPIADPEEENFPSPGVVSKRPFVFEKKRGSGGGNMPLMLMVVGVIVVFGLCMIAFLSSKGTAKKKMGAEAARPNLGRAQTATATGDLIPNDKVKPSPEDASRGGSVDATDIERTKSSKAPQTQISSASGSSNGGKQLGDVGKFEEPDTSPNGGGKWTPPPYGSTTANDQQATKKEEDALVKSSLVFVAHPQSKAHNVSSAATKNIENLGLAPGYHVAARLETMATTAVHAPVTAIIEYNYERDGHVLIPAGSRAIGKISQADPSGLMNITFSSIEFPGGENVAIDAVAADMSLQAIKGKVTGKQSGRSMLVRSLSGIGETTAMMVGAPSANSAFGENDLLRMRVADNIGNAGDEQIMRMMTMQHIVVSVPAGTEIYVIFEKASAVSPALEKETVQISPAGGSLPESIAATQP
jgi:hypothetical protein